MLAIPEFAVEAGEHPLGAELAARLRQARHWGEAYRAVELPAAAGRACFAEACARDIGRAAGAAVMLVGRVEMASDAAWRATTLLVDVGRGETLAAEWVARPESSGAAVVSAADELAQRLVEGWRRSAAPQAPVLPSPADIGSHPELRPPRPEPAAPADAVIAVLNFSAGATGRNRGSALAQRMRLRLDALTAARVMNAQETKQRLTAARMLAVDCSAADCAQELGRALDADYVVLGEVRFRRQVAGRVLPWTVAVTLFKVASGEWVSAAEVGPQPGAKTYLAAVMGAADQLAETDPWLFDLPSKDTGTEPGVPRD